VAAFLAMTVWLAASPEAVEAFFPDPDQRSSCSRRTSRPTTPRSPGTTFAVRVFTNNAGVGILAFGAGIAAGIPTLLVLAFNGVNVGLAGGLFHASGEAGRRSGP
jgi:uncharacterized membrane protein SpoIIM required for sporulation